MPIWLQVLTGLTVVAAGGIGYWRGWHDHGNRTWSQLEHRIGKKKFNDFVDANCRDLEDCETDDV